MMSTYDAIIVGGGPAGSTCARNLIKTGLETLVIDKAKFPRDKQCVGWVSPPVWDVIGYSPESYPKILWKYNSTYLHYGKNSYHPKVTMYFIRRFEFDDFLLKKSGASIIEGHHVRQIKRDNGFWVVDGTFRGKYLVGAGGSNCPVAKALFPKKRETPYTALQLEFQGNKREIAASRMGTEGDPEFLFHNDMRGFSWNVAKTDWINIGAATLMPKTLHKKWKDTKAFFTTAGHIPVSAHPMLENMKGCLQYLFTPGRLDACQNETAFLVGDALGVGHPITAEGILPAALSGKLCAQAIIADKPEQYSLLLSQHPLIKEYKAISRLNGVLTSIFGFLPSNFIFGKIICSIFKSMIPGHDYSWKGYNP